MFIVHLIVQLIVLIIAMVIAGMIMRWIVAHPQQCKAAWERTKTYVVTPIIKIRAFRVYVHCRRVRIAFTYRECLAREWQKYNKDRYPDQPYYRL